MLGGHLEAEKDPGHFVGKGYLKIAFDRVILPYGDLPVPAKVIQARGFKVDKKGDIDGKGHAKRDVAEWMVPPLWPWKVVSLPMRGPAHTEGRRAPRAEVDGRHLRSSDTGLWPNQAGPATIRLVSQAEHFGWEEYQKSISSGEGLTTVALGKPTIRYTILVLKIRRDFRDQQIPNGRLNKASEL
jgi:hypothetical protein